MSGSTRQYLLGMALTLGLVGTALAQQAAPASASPGPAAGPPAGFAAPAEPGVDENNAQRAKSQPGNNAPMWRAVRESGTQPGVSNLPGAEKGVLIQPFVQYPGSKYTTAGEAWRQVRQNWILPYGGALLLITLATIALTYWVKGPFGSQPKDTGRKIERFTPYERVIHWAAAISFSVLAISGIVIAFGKYFMLPVLGGTLFGWLTYLLKTAHNFVGPLFAVSLVLFSIKYLADNLPRAGDLNWLSKHGGMFSGEHVPSHRFNAGEKIMYWAGGVGLGLLVVASGLVLDGLVPGFGQTRGEMQISHIVHAVASVLMMAMFAGHIYMATLGVPGAMDAMRTGYVDESWAKEHHEWWYDDVKSGKILAVRSGAKPPAVTGSASAQA
ncbi:MAG TPA: formate dehydrogenase subunit gamma [Rubrivivax sp.]|nr:formate dehydrogenase subunit gamma [Rubrivivax sp.]